MLSEGRRREPLLRPGPPLEVVERQDQGLGEGVAVREALAAPVAADEKDTPVVPLGRPPGPAGPAVVPRRRPDVAAPAPVLVRPVHCTAQGRGRPPSVVLGSGRGP